MTTIKDFFKKNMNVDDKGKIPAIEKVLTDPLERKIATMLATSHEYKNKPAVVEAIKFVKNYKWEESTARLSDLQGINKPVHEDKVADMVEKLRNKKQSPLITVDKFHGIRPQTKGKKILVDGHHRKISYERIGHTETPIYKGTFTGGSEKAIEEVIDKQIK